MNDGPDVGSHAGHHPDADAVVGFLRSIDPGEPPVTLGPGSALRRRAAVRHARRQAAGAALAVAMIGIAVAGSVVGTRHHSATTASKVPIPSPPVTSSVSTSTEPSPIPSATPAAATFTIAAPTASQAATLRPSTESALPEVPSLASPYIRGVGPVTVGQSIFFTVRYTLHGSVAPHWVSVDYGDTTVLGGPETCPTMGRAPTGAGPADTPGELSTPSHSYTAPGTYTVRVTMSFGCIAGTAPVVLTRQIVVTGTAATASASPSAPSSPSASPAPSSPAPDSATPTP